MAKTTLIDAISAVDYESNEQLEMGNTYTVLVEGMDAQSASKVSIILDGSVLDVISNKPFIRHYETGMAPVSALLSQNTKAETISVHIYPSA